MSGETHLTSEKRGKPQRYKVQQDKGIYCLKGCDDGDLVDWGEYEAVCRERDLYKFQAETNAETIKQITAWHNRVVTEGL